MNQFFTIDGRVPLSKSELLPSSLACLWHVIQQDTLQQETLKIPDSIGLLNNTLRILQLEENELTGQLPFGMNRLTNVETVWLYDNLLTGNVPIGLCYFKRIGKTETIWIDCPEVGCSCNETDCEPEISTDFYFSILQSFRSYSSP